MRQTLIARSSLGVHRARWRELEAVHAVIDRTRHPWSVFGGSKLLLRRSIGGYVGIVEFDVFSEKDCVDAIVER